MADNDVAEVKNEAPAETEAVAMEPAVETPKVETKAEVDKKPTESEKPAEQKKEKIKDVAVPKEFSSLVKELDKLSALEISKFVKFLEKYWGVSAAAPAVALAPSVGTGGAEAAPAAEEKSEFDVILKDPGAQKVAVIKAA